MVPRILLNLPVQNLTALITMKKIPKKNSIDGSNLPDSKIAELLDRCAISVKGIKSKTKKKKKDGKQEQ